MRGNMNNPPGRVLFTSFPILQQFVRPQNAGSYLRLQARVRQVSQERALLPFELEQQRVCDAGE